MAGQNIPLDQFVIKIHSRCDLACDHCYVYEHADQSWQRRPVVVSPDTCARVAARIAEHATRHRLPRIDVILHGGEPLLAGPRRLDDILTTLRGALEGVTETTFKVHTNGVLLNQVYLDVFGKHRVSVGVSLDGDRAANDRHRRYANGNSSFDKVIRGIRLLRDRPELYSGLLCTIDVANDPITVYEALAELDPPRIDFLLPHATWEAPPPRPSPVAYADWLIKIFDRWEQDGRPFGIRLFDSVIATMYGRPSMTEAIGLEPSTLVVIDTDGSYEQLDSLKVAFDGAPATGFDVFNDSLDEVARHPGVQARQRGLEGLAEKCRQCPVVTSCGGGLYPHRFRAGSFLNPSVYCDDLLKLITHIKESVAMSHHSLTAATLDLLASGFGGEREIQDLAEAQNSLRRSLAMAVRESAPDSWAALVKLDERAPAAVTKVLAHPYVRVWAVDRLDGKNSPDYLGNIAAAAASASGSFTGSFTAEVSDGAVHLPGVGTFRGALRGPTATVSVTGGAVDVPGARGEWEPVRFLDDERRVLLEDCDPYRSCHQWPSAARLSDAEFAAWRERYAAAWEFITAHLPEYAPGLRAGLTALMPLSPAADGRDVSSTARHAFGAVAAALPHDAATMALLIVHEFQHVKLGAILDMFDLYDEHETGLFYAPWRDDPRPIEGLLQGTYAHLAVTDFWRRYRHVSGDPATAHRHFARWREHTATAIETLADSGALTELGARFAARMRETVAPWLAEEVPAEALAAARESARRHREAYEARTR
ncbi:FxsB family cyclophane-forming radical SAM/SPASM peptide maturase [Acrocarpospora sp. B8E8]|uniref:FxsB family cyclophane-forming radical SAM/SPASM peptide maturase n=1 Tax=Acrocarpospora sp. B8E8 TaxID=3153572 RepID=UPI00325E0796